MKHPYLSPKVKPGPDLRERLLIASGITILIILAVIITIIIIKPGL